MSSTLDTFQRFVDAEQQASYFNKWASQNPILLNKWRDFRDAILAGNRPTPPDMSTNYYGLGLVDAGRIYLDLTSGTPTPDPVPPPATDVGPSGIAMPTIDPAGWKTSFQDDFHDRTVSLGAWSSSTGDIKWNAYPYPWRGTPDSGTYWPEKTLSIHDHIFDIYIHTDSNGVHCIAAPMPRIPRPQMALRTEVCFKIDSFPGYKASWLLWPDSETWPRDGEIDFPEGNFNGNIGGYMHRQGATSGGDQDAYQGSIPMAGAWRTVVCEWKAGASCKFFVDGNKVLDIASRVPSTAMHYVLQNGVRFDQPIPDNSWQGHVLIDWWKAYVPV